MSLLTFMVHYIDKVLM